MSTSEKGFFTILEHVGESNFKIQENIPDSVEELIEISDSGRSETQDGKTAILLKTTKGRSFARLDEWPKNLLLEITKS